MTKPISNISAAHITNRYKNRTGIPKTLSEELNRDRKGPLNTITPKMNRAINL
jgi:hypothetical protein